MSREAKQFKKQDVLNTIMAIESQPISHLSAFALRASVGATDILDFLKGKKVYADSKAESVRFDHAVFERIVLSAGVKPIPSPQEQQAAWLEELAGLVRDGLSQVDFMPLADTGKYARPPHTAMSVTGARPSKDWR